MTTSEMRTAIETDTDSIRKSIARDLFMIALVAVFAICVALPVAFQTVENWKNTRAEWRPT